MQPNELPEFITKKKRVKPRRNKTSAFVPAAGDTGTPELKQRMLEADLAAMSIAERARYQTAKGKDMKVGVAFEARSRSSTWSVPLNEAAMAVLLKQVGKHPERVFTYRGKPLDRGSTTSWYKALREVG